jgi:hypothetical protein
MKFLSVKTAAIALNKVSALQARVGKMFRKKYVDFCLSEILGLIECRPAAQ